MSGPSNIKIQKMGAEDIGNGHGRCPLLILSVRRDPDIMSGALYFSGTRVPVKNLFDYLEGSSSLDEFLEDFPTVSRERAVAVLEAAHESLTANTSAV